MNTLNGQTVLVCGGAGFIGSNFIRLILSRYPKVKVVNFDKLTYSGNLDNLKDIERDSRYTFIKGDIADEKAVLNVFKTYKPHYIANFAAETHVDCSIHVGAKIFIQTNVIGVYYLLEGVRKHKVKKFLQVSTDEVYGSLELSSKVKFTEKTLFDPSTPYSATKADGDLLCNAYFRTWRTPVVITRCSNNFGPYQYPEKLIPFFVMRMMEEKKLPLYGDGKNVRDWIYVLDHCRALELCLLKGTPGEVYNIGASSEKNNKEIASEILSYFGKDRLWLEFVADRPGHDRRYAINSSKIEKELGWKPRHSFQDALHATLEWYVHNRAWLNNIKKKAKHFNSHIKTK
ncbi:dTDP-glucose 4,6-dehydratase [Candidatus Azambacteria bacterium]|nr:dTDP-glucose 4,6-dehydratase [Candidatus Azambacteria bacterium]